MEDLLRNWKHAIKTSGSGGVFVKDGIVHADVWGKERIKLLFILKEVHGDLDQDSKNGTIDLDLTKFLRGGGGADTWNNVARWASILLDNRNWDSWRSDVLNRIAAINVKKTFGGSTSDWREIQTNIRNYREYIRRQIELIQPTLIISCIGNLWYELKDSLSIVRSDTDSFISELGKEMEYGFFKLEDGRMVPIIEYRHPNRCSIEKSQIDMRNLREKFILKQ